MLQRIREEDEAMRSHKMTKVAYCNVRLRNHRFCNDDEDQPSRFVIKMPFSSKNPDGRTVVEFNVSFDVIDGAVTFLLGLPTLVAMVASENHKYMTSAFLLND